MGNILGDAARDQRAQRQQNIDNQISDINMELRKLAGMEMKLTKDVYTLMDTIVTHDMPKGSALHEMVYDKLTQMTYNRRRCRQHIANKSGLLNMRQTLEREADTAVLNKLMKQTTHALGSGDKELSAKRVQKAVIQFEKQTTKSAAKHDIASEAFEAADGDDEEDAKARGSSVVDSMFEGFHQQTVARKERERAAQLPSPPIKPVLVKKKPQVVTEEE